MSTPDIFLFQIKRCVMMLDILYNKLMLILRYLLLFSFTLDDSLSESVSGYSAVQLTAMMHTFIVLQMK